MAEQRYQAVLAVLKRTFASIAVNYRAAEVVDRTQVVTGSSRRTVSGLAAEATQRRPVRSGCL